MFTTFTKLFAASAVVAAMAWISSPMQAEAQVVIAPTPVVSYYRPRPILRPFTYAPAVTYGATVAAPVTSYYAPATTAYYAPTTSYYAPATTSYYAPATTSYYAPATTSYYAPTTTYYAPSVSAPVTSYYAPSVVAPVTTYYRGW
jgi:hypothetical protein